MLRIIYIVVSLLSYKTINGELLHTSALIESNDVGGGGCNPKKPNATANFKFGTGFFDFIGFFFFFFSVFPFWPILTGLTGCCYVVLVGYNSFCRAF